MSSPTARARRTPRFRFTTRRLLLALSVLAVMFAMYGWFYRSFAAPRRYAMEIELMIRSLESRRPADMTRGQWRSAVAWTLNLNANSLVRFQADPSQIKALHGRLEKKLRGPVDMSTIDWIWDEYAELTPAGANYQRFKEMMFEEIASVGPNDDVWQMNVP